MFIPSYIKERWQKWAQDFEAVNAQVDGARIAREVLADLETLEKGGGQELLSLKEAARLSGYSADHLGRLVREGKLENHGRKNAPQIRRDQLPIKPGHLPPAPDNANVEHPSSRRVALAVIGRGIPDGTSEK